MSVVELTDYQQHLREKYTESLERRNDDGPVYRVNLHIANQQFLLDLDFEDVEEAEWTRDMLAKALATLVKQEREEYITSDGTNSQNNL